MILYPIKHVVIHVVPTDTKSRALEILLQRIVLSSWPVSAFSVVDAMKRPEST